MNIYIYVYIMSYYVMTKSGNTWEQYLYQFQWDKSPTWGVSFHFQVIVIYIPLIEVADWKLVNFLTKHCMRFEWFVVFENSRLYK